MQPLANMNLRLIGTRGIEHKFEKTIVRSYELKARIKKQERYDKFGEYMSRTWRGFASNE